MFQLCLSLLMTSKSIQFNKQILELTSYWSMNIMLISQLIHYMLKVFSILPSLHSSALFSSNWYSKTPILRTVPDPNAWIRYFARLSAGRLYLDVAIFSSIFLQTAYLTSKNMLEIIIKIEHSSWPCSLHNKKSMAMTCYSKVEQSDGISSLEKTWMHS